jgi:hypothetical protein
MIRPLTIVTMLLAAGSGLYLYQAKQKVRVLDRQISDIRTATEATRQRAEVLRAEYTLLNDPTRLAELVSAHLPNLRPTQPAQWTSMAELDKRLPPVGDGVAPPAAEEAPSPPVAAAEPARPAPAAPPPAAVVARAAPPHPIVALAHEALPAARPPVRTAASVMPVAPRSVPRAAAAPAVPAVPTTQVLATLRPAAPSAATSAAPMVASALGMARAMMAPVAVTPAAAATLPVASGVPPR